MKYTFASQKQTVFKARSSGDVLCSMGMQTCYCVVIFFKDYITLSHLDYGSDFNFFREENVQTILVFYNSDEEYSKESAEKFSAFVKNEYPLINITEKAIEHSIAEKIWCFSEKVSSLVKLPCTAEEYIDWASVKIVSRIATELLYFFLYNKVFLKTASIPHISSNQCKEKKIIDFALYLLDSNKVYFNKPCIMQITDKVTKTIVKLYFNEKITQGVVEYLNVLRQQENSFQYSKLVFWPCDNSDYEFTVIEEENAVNNYLETCISFFSQYGYNDSLERDFCISEMPRKCDKNEQRIRDSYYARFNIFRKNNKPLCFEKNYSEQKKELKS